MGLAANGRQGVAEIIGILNEELRRIRSVSGCSPRGDIDSDILVKHDFVV